MCWQGGGRYLSGDAAVVPGVAAQVLTAQQQLLFQLLLQPLRGSVHDVPLLGELQHRANGDCPPCPGQLARPAGDHSHLAVGCFAIKPVCAQSPVQVGEPG